MEWSPPSTIGVIPSSKRLGNGIAVRVQVSAICFRYRALATAEVCVSAMFDLDVAAVLHLMTERLKAGLKAGYAHCRRPHVHAAAAGAHVQRYPDHANLAGGSDWVPLGGKEVMRGLISGFVAMQELLRIPAPAIISVPHFSHARKRYKSGRSAITGVGPIPQKVYRNGLVSSVRLIPIGASKNRVKSPNMSN